MSKDSTTDTAQAGRDAKIHSDNVNDAKGASDAGSSSSSIPHSQTIASASTSVKPPVQSTSEVAVEQIKDHGYQNINVNVNEIEELAKTQDEGYVADVTTLGVTDLQDGYSKLQSRSNLYKNRLLQVIFAGFICVLTIFTGILVLDHLKANGGLSFKLFIDLFMTNQYHFLLLKLHVNCRNQID